MLAHHLLRRHVIRRADQRAGVGHARANLRGARDAEIHHDHPAALVHHDVLRLQVAVHHSFGVRRIQRRASLVNDVGAFLIAQFFFGQGAQVLPLDKLHGDELDAVDFAKIENANHIFVGDFARQDQLLLEAPQHFFVQREFGTNDFQGHEAIELQVPRLVHRAHAAFAKHQHNFVASAEARTVGDAAAAKCRSGGTGERLRPALRAGEIGQISRIGSVRRMRGVSSRDVFKVFKKCGVAGGKRSGTSSALRRRRIIGRVAIRALSEVRRHRYFVIPRLTASLASDALGGRLRFYITA